MQSDIVGLRQQITIFRLKRVDGEILIEEICTVILCNCQKLYVEYHYVLECSFFNEICKQLLPKYLMKRHNVVKFLNLCPPRNNHANYEYLSNISIRYFVLLVCPM